MCRSEPIPDEEQIRAATILGMRETISTTAEGEGFHMAVEEIYAARTREEEMVQKLLKEWQKGAHSTYWRQRRRMLFGWDVGYENVNSLSLFHPTKSKMHMLTNLH